MEDNSKYVGISVSSVLGIVFIVLKLVKVIDWDWFWVLFPFFSWVFLLLFCFILACVIVMIRRIFRSFNK